MYSKYLRRLHVVNIFALSLYSQELPVEAPRMWWFLVLVLKAVKLETPFAYSHVLGRRHATCMGLT